MKKRARRMYVLLSTVMAVMALLGVMWILNMLPQKEKPLLETKNVQVNGESQQITADTKIEQEMHYWCQDIKTIAEPVKSWIGQDAVELYGKFNPDEGWELKSENPKKIKIVKQVEDFCDRHQGYRHLGIDQGKVAVFQGPIGCQNILLQRESILVKDLPETIQNKLWRAMSFQKLSSADQAELRASFEFNSDASINAFLDNWDEFLRD